MEFIMHIDTQGYALPIDPALIAILNRQLESLTTPPARLVLLQFRDPDYDVDAGGFHPVDIAVDDRGRIQWITDFAYTEVEGITELGRELDFDLSRGIFQHRGFCQPLAYGADLFQLWQSNFIHYVQMNVFDVQIQAT
jgi:hypothetical protein